jgi:hypothetical protein
MTAHEAHQVQSAAVLVARAARKTGIGSDSAIGYRESCAPDELPFICRLRYILGLDLPNDPEQNDRQFDTVGVSAMPSENMRAREIR